MCEVSVDQPRVSGETDPWPSLHTQYAAREQLTNVEQSTKTGRGDIFLTLHAGKNTSTSQTYMYFEINT